MDDGDLWTLYRSFLAVAQHDSLSRGGKAIGLSQPTIGRHIAALQERLGGTALFTRSARGLLPTDAGRAIRPHVEAMAAAAAAIRRTVSAPEEAAAGVVRISASDMIGGAILPAILADLRAAHPGLVVELSLSNQTEDVLGRAVDIAIRMVRPTQQALVVRRIGKVPLGLHGHRRYLERAGTPRRLSDLAGHAVIGFDRETPFLKGAAAKLALDRTRFALRTDSDLAAFAAIEAGFGLGVCQVPLARRTPDLVRVLPDAVAFDLDSWIVMHEDLKRVRRVRLTFDHLAAGLRAYLGA